MKLSEIREVLGDEEVKSISRRYFISNGFDGTLTSIGIAVGSYLSGVPSGITVFKVGIGAGVGLATSGVWSVWEIEKAEKLSELNKLEKQMQKDLDNTKIKQKKMEARKINTIMSGLGPTIGIVFPLIPFLVEPIVGMLYSTIAAIIIGVIILTVFGAYMGKISGQRIYRSGLRMGLAGIIVALINIALPG